jgi:hypothetical protein
VNKRRPRNERVNFESLVIGQIKALARQQRALGSPVTLNSALVQRDKERGFAYFRCGSALKTTEPTGLWLAREQGEMLLLTGEPYREWARVRSGGRR